MPNKRSVILVNGEIYHLYNRSVANEQIFIKQKDINRVLEIIRYYKNVSDLRFSFFNKLDSEKKEEYLKSKKLTPLIEIYTYCIMPNHFHLIVKQISDKGIERFMANFQNSFAKYYNTKNKRFGALFQRPFKAKHVITDEELLHLSRYIHLNPVTSYIIDFESLKRSLLTSLSYYLKPNVDDFINTKLIYGIIKTPGSYIKFLENQIDYQRKLNNIRHLIIDK